MQRFEKGGSAEEDEKKTETTATGPGKLEKTNSWNSAAKSTVTPAEKKEEEKKSASLSSSSSGKEGKGELSASKSPRPGRKV